MSKIVNIDKYKYKPGQMLEDLTKDIDITESLIVIRIKKNGVMDYSNTDIIHTEAIGIMEVVKQQFIYNLEDE